MSRQLPRLALAVFIATLAACQTTRPSLEPSPIDVMGLKHAVAVGDLTIGGQPDRSALEALANEGYRSVVTNRSEGEIDWDERAVVEELGMSFLRIEIANPVSEITDAEAAAFAEFMSERTGPALLHCGSGNRAAGLWAVWLIEEKGVEPDEAIRLAKSAGMRESITSVVERRISEKRTSER